MKIAHISISDWATSVAGMTLEEEGFFWRLTRLMYANESVFPDNDRQNCELMGLNIRVYRRLKERLLTRRERRHKPVIELHDGYIVNHRFVQEIEKFCAAKKASSDWGKAGADARWNRHRPKQVSLKLEPNLVETSPKLREKSEPKPKEINGSVMATPYSNLHTPKESPLPPKGVEHRGQALPALKSEINPYRKRDPMGLNPDLDVEKIGIGWTEEGNLQVFNGVRASMLEGSGSEDQLKRDLLIVQASSKISPSMNPYMVRTKALGIHAEIIDRRQQGDRRYRQVAADNKRGAAKPSIGSRSFLDDLPPTHDEREIALRFDRWATETTAGRQAVAKHGRDSSWQVFRDLELKKAGVPA